MKHIVVDLEMNNISRKFKKEKKCKMEIIEIGAVMLDENLQEISQFRSYVKPELNDRINSNIVSLTGITTEMVAQAPNFTEAMKAFTSWCLSFGRDITLYAWSTSDYLQVIGEAFEKHYPVDEVEQKIFYTEWMDFQAMFDKKLGFERQLSLALAMEMAGIDFAGNEHTAMADARNTAELLHVFKDERLFNKTLAKIEEVMKPTPIGNTLGSLFDFSSLELAV